MSLDELRQNIERRLAELAEEAQRLQAALTALGVNSRSTSAPTRTGDLEPAAATKPRRTARPSPRPAKRGATRQAVLDALSDGHAFTAGDVANVTGLKRATISTTLSNLLADGRVQKAHRGYTRTATAAESAAADAGTPAP